MSNSVKKLIIELSEAQGKRVLKIPSKEGGEKVLPQRCKRTENQALTDFVHSNPQFCAMLKQFMEQGEAGKIALDLVSTKIEEVYEQSAEQGKKPGLTLGEKIENLFGK